MKRMLLLLAVSVLGTAASATTAQAETITNETRSVTFAGFVPCADAGAGEVLSGTIEVHDLITSTVNGSTVSGTFQSQPHGAMAGAATGDTYRVAGVTQGTFHERLDGDQYTRTYVNSFRLIGPGSSNNLLVHEIAHLTIGANGDVTAEHDVLSIECS